MPKPKQKRTFVDELKEFFHFSGPGKAKKKQVAPPMGGAAGEAQKKLKGRGEQLDRKIREAGG